ncbi:MAG: DUF2726 domain-containing protein [Bacillota bacterium]
MRALGIQIDIVYILYLIIFLCFAYIIKEKFRYVRENKDPKVKESVTLPYVLMESVLSTAELSFYLVLKSSVGRKGVICPKVGLKEIFQVDEDVGKEYLRFFGKISRKHVDFLICDPLTLRPVCGIELTQVGRVKKDHYERAEFINKIYKDANFTLLRMPLKNHYTKKEVDGLLKGAFQIDSELEH